MLEKVPETEDNNPMKHIQGTLNSDAAMAAKVLRAAKNGGKVRKRFLRKESRREAGEGNGKRKRKSSE